MLEGMNVEKAHSPTQSSAFGEEEEEKEMTRKKDSFAARTRGG